MGDMVGMNLTLYTPGVFGVLKVSTGVAKVLPGVSKSLVCCEMFSVLLQGVIQGFTCVSLFRIEFSSTSLNSYTESIIYHLLIVVTTDPDNFTGTS